MNNKKKLVKSVISLLLAVVLLIGCTFTTGREAISSLIKSLLGSTGSTFGVQLSWSDDPVNNGWYTSGDTENSIAFTNADRWEPGRTEIRYFKVSNTGDIDFTYQLKIEIPTDEMTELEYAASKPIGDVIDVYISKDITNISSREKVGTLNECFVQPQILEEDLSAGSDATCAITLVMQTDAGNDYQTKYDENNVNINAIGFNICADAFAEETEEPDYDGFGFALGDDNKLYRVGNGNTVTVSSLFGYNDETSTDTNSLFALSAFADDTPDDSLVTFTSSTVAGNATVTYTANTTDWTSGTFGFSGTGVMNLVLKYNGNEKVNVNLEVVNGNNATSAVSANKKNVVLLNDVTSTYSLGVYSATLYGNGFSITDSRSDTSGTSGFFSISNGVVDNVRIIGQEYTEVITSGQTNQNYSPCVRVDGGGSIYNSNVSGCRYAILNSTGNLLIEDSVISGGTLANIRIDKGYVTFKDSTTSKSFESSAVNGVGILIASVDAKLIIEGSFTQYNWISETDFEDDFPDTFQTALSFAYDDSTFAYTNGGTKYIHAGIVCFDEATAFTEATASAAIPNKPSGYTSILKTKLGETAVLYADPASNGSTAKITGLGSYTSAGQYPTLPDVTFDYTTLNYIEKTADSNKYCYYDSNTGKVCISFETTEGSFSWNPMILTSTKYGSNISYTVSMNGTDYTDKNISFTTAGDYEVTYTYTDSNYYYGSNASKDSITYTKTVNINVVVCDPAVVVYHPAFTFGTSYATASKQVVINNNTYVMPDIESADSTNYGSVTVGDQTVYYPIVTVNGASSSGGSYSSGNLYYFAPAFSKVKIVDYDQSSGSTKYTYNSSTKTWPHDNSDKPDTTIYYFDTSGATPFEPACGSSAWGYKFLSDSGLCYATNELTRDGRSGNKVVKFYYVGTDGVTYYYYICYAYTETTYSKCFATGTDITLADGSQKPIEKLTYSDKLLVWNFFKGGYDEQSIAILVNHGEQAYRIVNTVYSDGTVLRIIGEHGVFDYDLNKYIYLSEGNYRNYIGHRFVKYNSKGGYSIVKLTNAYVTTEKTCAYSITSACSSNVFAEGMLTVAPPDDFYNWIDMGGKLMYDTDAFNADVKKYGLYDYDVFKDYVTYEQFVAFNGPYLKVAVEKGEFSFNYIIQLIKQYSKYFD